MNIFVLDEDPRVAAHMMCDKHIVKMPTEAVQLLSNQFPIKIAPYKPTHTHHPCSIWVAQSQDNFDWLFQHAEELLKEYNYRYDGFRRGKHRTTLRALELIRAHAYMLRFPRTGLTPFAQSMPDEYKHVNAVVAYRRYYIHEKKFARWCKTRREPSWWRTI